MVKKPKLDKHGSMCHSAFTCIDCSKTFQGPAQWKSHTSCISEAEKYQGNLYKGPKGVRLSLCDRYLFTHVRTRNKMGDLGAMGTRGTVDATAMLLRVSINNGVTMGDSKVADPLGASHILVTRQLVLTSLPWVLRFGCRPYLLPQYRSPIRPPRTLPSMRLRAKRHQNQQLQR